MAERGGQPGNDNAAVGASIRDAINYELAALGREIKKQTDSDEPALKVGMRAMVSPHVRKSAEGDLSSFNAMADRIDGKPSQSLNVDADVRATVVGTVRFAE